MSIPFSRNGILTLLHHHHHIIQLRILLRYKVIEPSTIRPNLLSLQTRPTQQIGVVGKHTFVSACKGYGGISTHPPTMHVRSLGHRIPHTTLVKVIPGVRTVRAAISGAARTPTGVASNSRESIRFDRF